MHAHWLRACVLLLALASGAADSGSAAPTASWDPLNSAAALPESTWQAPVSVATDDSSSSAADDDSSAVASTDPSSSSSVEDDDSSASSAADDDDSSSSVAADDDSAAADDDDSAAADAECGDNLCDLLEDCPADCGSAFVTVEATEARASRLTTLSISIVASAAWPSEFALMLTWPGAYCGPPDDAAVRVEAGTSLSDVSVSVLDAGLVLDVAGQPHAAGDSAVLELYGLANPVEDGPQTPMVLTVLDAEGHVVEQASAESMYEVLPDVRTYVGGDGGDWWASSSWDEGLDVEPTMVALVDSGATASIGESGLLGGLAVPAGLVHISDGALLEVHRPDACVSRERPIISPLPHVRAPLNESVGPLRFSVSDVDTPLARVSVNVTSSNQTVVADGALQLSSPDGGNFSLSINGDDVQTLGTSTISIEAFDGFFSAVESFALVVNRTQGALHDASWTADAPAPSRYTDVELSFTTQQLVRLPAELRVRLPGGWSCAEGRTGVALSASEVGAVECNEPADMTIHLAGHGWHAQEAVTVALTSVSTPASAQRAATAATLSTWGTLPNGFFAVLDGPAAVAVAAVPAGALGVSWTVPAPHPLQELDVAVALGAPHGRLAAGASLQFEFPASWSAPDALALTSAAPADELAELTLAGVVAPAHSEVGAANVTVSALAADGGLIDGPATLALPAVTAGAIAATAFEGALRFPGASTSAALNATLTSALGAGSAVVLACPESFGAAARLGDAALAAAVDGDGSQAFVTVLDDSALVVLLEAGAPAGALLSLTAAPMAQPAEPYAGGVGSLFTITADERLVDGPAEVAFTAVDYYGEASFAATAVAAREDDFEASVVLTRTGGSFLPMTVRVAAVEGSGDAVAGEDFAFDALTVTWADGDADPVEVFVSITDESVEEGAESFQLELSGDYLGANTTVTFTIAANDEVPAPDNTTDPGTYAAAPTLERAALVDTAWAFDLFFSSGGALCGDSALACDEAQCDVEALLSASTLQRLGGWATCAFEADNATARVYYDAAYDAAATSVSLRGGYLRSHALSSYWAVGSAELEPRAAAPTVESAQFSDSGTALTVLLAGQSSGMLLDSAALVDCLSVFQEDALGAGAQCSMPSELEIAVVVGSGASLEPGDRLTLQEGVVRPVADSVLSASGWARVAAPANPVEPAAALVAPATVGACDDLALDASGSSGGAGRALELAWSVETSAAGGAANLTAFLSAADSSDGVVVPSALLEDGAEYVFRVNATNFLAPGAWSTAAAAVTRSALPLPALVVDGGAAHSFERNGASYSLRARAEPSGCGVAPGLEYSWDARNHTGVGSGNDPKLLTIEPFALEPGRTYEFEAVVADPAMGTSASTVVAVRVEAGPLEAAISGGSRRTTSAGADLTLDAASATEDTAEWDAFEAAYAWSVEPAVEGLLLAGEKVGQLTVPAGTLDAGEYTFTVNVTKGTRWAVASTVVEVSSYSLPSVAIAPPAAGSRPDPAAYVSFSANVSAESESAEIAFQEWTVSSGSLLLPDDEAFVTPRDRVEVLLRPGAMQGGYTYAFRLTVQDSLGATAFAELEISPNAAPTSGYLTVAPAAGEALSTSFAVAAAGWADDARDLPLAYSFGYSADGGADVQLGSFSSVASRESTLPRGTVAFVAYVRDQLGAVAETRALADGSAAVAEVAAASGGVASAVNQTAALLSAAVANQDGEAAVGVLSMLASSISGDCERLGCAATGTCVNGTACVCDDGYTGDTCADRAPVDGGWTDWGDWSPCSASCGGGVSQRARACTSPAPEHGGADCAGNATEEAVCNDVACVVVVDGGYAEWGDWSECSASCPENEGGWFPGTQTRARTCTDPTPSADGQDCVAQGLGEASEERECNTEECPYPLALCPGSSFSVECSGHGLCRREPATCTTNDYACDALECECEAGYADSDCSLTEAEFEELQAVRLALLVSTAEVASMLDVNAETLTMQADVLAMVTAAPGQLSDEAASLATDMVSSVVESSKGAALAISDETGASLLSSVSGVLLSGSSSSSSSSGSSLGGSSSGSASWGASGIGSASSSSSSSSSSSDASDASEASSEAGADNDQGPDIRDLVSDIATAMMVDSEAGADPVTIATDALALSSQREYAGFVESSAVQTASGATTSSSFPSTWAAESGVALTTKVDVQTVFWSVDPAGSGQEVLSLSVQDAEGGEEVPVNGLSQAPLSLTVPVSSSADADALTCDFRDDASGLWVDSGLSVEGLSQTDGVMYLTCATTHLTEFSAGAGDNTVSVMVVDPVGDADLLLDVSAWALLPLIVIASLWGVISFIYLDRTYRGMRSTNRFLAAVRRVYSRLGFVRVPGPEALRVPPVGTKPWVAEYKKQLRSLHPWVSVYLAPLEDHATISAPESALILLNMCMASFATTAMFYKQSRTINERILGAFCGAVLMVPSTVLLPKLFELINAPPVSRTVQQQLEKERLRAARRKKKDKAKAVAPVVPVGSKDNQWVLDEPDIAGPSGPPLPLQLAALDVPEVPINGPPLAGPAEADVADSPRMSRPHGRSPTKNAWAGGPPLPEPLSVGPTPRVDPSEPLSPKKPKETNKELHGTQRLASLAGHAGPPLMKVEAARGRADERMQQWQQGVEVAAPYTESRPPFEEEFAPRARWRVALVAVNLALFVCAVSLAVSAAYVTLTFPFGVLFGGLGLLLAALVLVCAVLGVAATQMRRTSMAKVFVVSTLLALLAHSLFASFALGANRDSISGPLLHRAWGNIYENGETVDDALSDIRKLQREHTCCGYDGPDDYGVDCVELAHSQTGSALNATSLPGCAEHLQALFEEELAPVVWIAVVVGSAQLISALTMVRALFLKREELDAVVVYRPEVVKGTVSTRDLREVRRRPGVVRAIVRMQSVFRGNQGRVVATRVRELHSWQQLSRPRRALKVIATFLVLVITLFLTYVNIIYSVKFQDEVSGQWTASVVGSLVASMVLIEPFKVAVLLFVCSVVRYLSPPKMMVEVSVGSADVSVGRSAGRSVGRSSAGREPVGVTL